MTTILDAYSTAKPTLEGAIGIFSGEWSSRLPPPHQDVSGGRSELFSDGRITWALQKLGGASGKTVLELGPLEGGHAYQLSRAGAESVVSVESNSRAFLKCLLIKELFGLDKCHFLYGDCVEYLKGDGRFFDMAFASGVLYHMRNPLELIGLLSAVTKNLFIWTHYYDASAIKCHHIEPARFTDVLPLSFGGYTAPHHRHEYRSALDWAGFCGGSADHSLWLERADIIGSLQHFGFQSVEVAFEDPATPNGPAFAIAARK